MCAVCVSCVVCIMCVHVCTCVLYVCVVCVYHVCVVFVHMCVVCVCREKPFPLVDGVDKLKDRLLTREHVQASDRSCLDRFNGFFSLTVRTVYKYM